MVPWPFCVFVVRYVLFVMFGVIAMSVQLSWLEKLIRKLRHWLGSVEPDSDRRRSNERFCTEDCDDCDRGVFAI